MLLSSQDTLTMDYKIFSYYLQIQTSHTVTEGCSLYCLSKLTALLALQNNSEIFKFALTYVRFHKGVLQLTTTQVQQPQRNNQVPSRRVREAEAQQPSNPNKTLQEHKGYQKHTSTQVFVIKTSFLTLTKNLCSHECVN